jgi:hypothetical protein
VEHVRPSLWQHGPIAVSQGSFPGTDPAEPVRIMAGENPDLPSIPELPDRGPGAEMIGRTLAMLGQVAPEFAGETTPSGWRLAGRSTDAASSVMRRAMAWLRHDWDTAEDGYQGAPACKVALAGPWTLAASVELRNGHRMLFDPGAMRDLVAAYPGVVAAAAQRLLGTWPEAVVQIDEPWLPGVLAARITTPSGLDFYRSVAAEDARRALAAAVDSVHAAGASAVLHCCAVPAPVALLRETGADGISLDLTGQAADGRSGHHEEALGVLLESQCRLVAGVVPWRLDGGPAEPVGASVTRLISLLDRLGIPLDVAAGRLAVSTPCGVAGASPGGARAVTQRVSEVVRIVTREVSA